MRTDTCTHDGCGQEIRFGVRDGKPGWWHREPVDHEPIHGRRFTAADAAEVERQLDLPRERFKPTKTGWPLLFTIETYTARGYFLERMKKEAREALLHEGLTDDEVDDLEAAASELPEVEVRRTPIERSDDRCPQGARNLMNAAARSGFEVRRLTYSRGPRIGAKGQLLSISDWVVVGAVDSAGHVAVACWADAKVSSAWYGEIGGRIDLTTITDLKNKMKEAHSGSDTDHRVPDEG